jgi:hypothetical protein
MTAHSRTCLSGLFGLTMVGLTACGSSLQGGSGKGGAGGSSASGTAGSPGTATGTGGGSGNGATGGAGPGSGGSGPAGAGGSSSGNPGACVPGIPATSQFRRMTNAQYDAVVRDLLGVTSVTVGGNAGPPSALLFSDFDGPMVADAWRLYTDVGAAIAKAVMASATQKARFITCDPATTGCLTSTIKAFGRKAFRRPLTDAEVARLAAIGDPPSFGTPDDVAEATLQAFLMSPSFISLPELNTTPDPGGQGIQLSSFEVATRLSFLLWGSIPDDVLNTAADNDALQTKQQILAQAQRMLAMRDKAAPQVTAFHRHWAHIDDSSGHWWKMDHDATKYPLFTPAAKAAAAAETDDFFAEVAFTNGSYKDLLLSNIGFVNEDNAGIYGLTSADSALTKTPLDSAQRPGFLTRAGFLSSYSHYDVTAPILRGAFIAAYMIGLDTGPAPLGTSMIQPPAGNYLTNRERMEALTSQSASCVACHTNILNPPGYVLENYDAIGKWQVTDPLGGAIDATATVNLGDGNVKQVGNAQQLMQELARSPQAQRMYAQNMVAYGYGRDPNANDACVVDQLGAKLAADGYTILDLVADLTQADSFRLRVKATP